MQELMKSELEQVSGGCYFFSLFNCSQHKPSHSCAPSHSVPSHSCGSTPPVVVPPVVIPPTGGGGSTGG